MLRKGSDRGETARIGSSRFAAACYFFFFAAFFLAGFLAFLAFFAAFLAIASLLYGVGRDCPQRASLSCSPTSSRSSCICSTSRCAP
jgi:hypothetical protein